MIGYHNKYYLTPPMIYTPGLPIYPDIGQGCRYNPMCSGWACVVLPAMRSLAGGGVLVASRQTEGGVQVKFRL